jgi:hypothetical protein
VEPCQLKCLGKKSLNWSSRLFTPSRRHQGTFSAADPVHHRLREDCRGQTRGPLIIERNPFFTNNKTQTNSQNVKYTSRNHGVATGGAHGPGNLSGPSSGRPRHPSGKSSPRSRGPTPYHQNSASLEGWTPPQAKLRLPRGMDAPSGETLPRSRAGRLRGETPPRSRPS